MTHGASSVQVPPQSTGKRVATTARTFLKYDNLTGAFDIGDTVQGSNSNATGIVTANLRVGFASTVGQLVLRNVAGTFQDNENLEVSASPQAVSQLDDALLPLVEYDYQSTVAADPDNPLHLQRIDRFGAATTTFTDGAPHFGAFGTMSIGEPQIIKDYRFAYGKIDEDHWESTSGAGTITYVSDPGLVLLSTGTATGDLARRTTNFYHPYAAGVGQLIEMTVRVSDTGKTNVRRRWGYFDEDNGVYFEHDGTDLFVVMRSNVTGSVVETSIIQADWNVDQMDGSNSIGFNLDISNPNIYWMDLQWLGAGRVRFGVIESSGARLIGHVLEHANLGVAYPYMRTASLPVRIEQENTGSASGTSELRFACASVKHSSKAQISGKKHSADSGLVTVAQADGEVPVFSFRPKTEVNSIPNRGIIRLAAISFANITNTGGSPVIFRIRIGTDAELTSDMFASHETISMTEVDTSATAITGTTHVLTTTSVAADKTLHIRDTSERTIHVFELFLNADGSTQPVIIITAECVAGTNADVIVAINWEEILA